MKSGRQAYIKNQANRQIHKDIHRKQTGTQTNRKADRDIKIYIEDRQVHRKGR